MKNRASMVAIVIALILFPTAALRLVAQEHNSRHHHYELVDVGTFGGPNSWMSNPAVVRLGLFNNQGTLTGEAETPAMDPYCYWSTTDCHATSAFQWEKGVTTDLGVLPGGIGSAVNWISSNGVMVGIADNGQQDPLTGLPQIHGVVWQGDTVTDLGTFFGGYDTWALSVNGRGEIVGEAFNTIPDPLLYVWLRVSVAGVLLEQRGGAGSGHSGSRQ